MHQENLTHAQLLMQAVLANNCEETAYAISCGANVNAPDDEGERPLCIAVYEGNTDVVSLLLENGADPDAINDFDEPVIMTASMEGHLDIVLLLVAHGADIEKTDSDGHTAIDIAEFYGHNAIAEYLKMTLEMAASANVPPDDPSGKTKRLSSRILSLLPHKAGHLANVS